MLNIVNEPLINLTFFSYFFFIMDLFNKNKSNILSAPRHWSFLPFFISDFHKHALWEYPVLLVYLQHRVLCTISGEVAYGVIVQQESVFTWLEDYFWCHPSVFMWSLLLNDVVLFCYDAMCLVTSYKPDIIYFLSNSRLACPMHWNLLQVYQIDLGRSRNPNVTDSNHSRVKPMTVKLILVIS